MTAAPSLSAALCALLFVGLSLVQALLSHRATHANRAAMKELRGAMKESFQRHHASLEILAKMIRAQPVERFSIELPHAPDFEIAAAAPTTPVAPAPAALRCEPPAVPSSAPPPTDATPESQRPTVALTQRRRPLRGGSLDCQRRRAWRRARTPRQLGIGWSRYGGIPRR